MPIIIACGDDKHIRSFCGDYADENRQETIVVHTGMFVEAISDVIEDDLLFHHIITGSLYKSERYITYCHAKRFRTGYIVLFFTGDISSDLEVPLKSNRYDNPMIVVDNYAQSNNKNDLFEEIRQTLRSRKCKISHANTRVIQKDNHLEEAKRIVNRINEKYSYRNVDDIYIEAENQIMKIIGSQKLSTDEVEKYYKSILVNALCERGLLDDPGM